MGGRSCVCMCEINNLLHHRPSWGFKDEIDYIRIVTAIPSITYTLSLQCKGNRLFLSYDVCVSVCVFVVRQVDGACTESERRSQAGRQAAAVLGLPFGAKGFLPLFPSSPSRCVSWIFTPEALCRRKRLPSTHSRFLHSRPIQHPPTGHRWLSMCQKTYTVKWNIQREV